MRRNYDDFCVFLFQLIIIKKPRYDYQYHSRNPDAEPVLPDVDSLDVNIIVSIGSGLS